MLLYESFEILENLEKILTSKSVSLFSYFWPCFLTNIIERSKSFRANLYFLNSHIFKSIFPFNFSCWKRWYSHIVIQEICWCLLLWINDTSEIIKLLHWKRFSGWIFWIENLFDLLNLFLWSWSINWNELRANLYFSEFLGNIFSINKSSILIKTQNHVLESLLFMMSI